MAKRFSQSWIFETLMEHPTFLTKRMFGGLAVYLHGKMMLLLAEGPGETSYRGVDYKVEIWNGVLLPTDREHHDSLMKEFPCLMAHPVLGKWVYLPADHIEFESQIDEIIKCISKDDERFGIFPKVKTKSRKKKKSKSKKKSPVKKAAKKKKSAQKNKVTKNKVTKKKVTKKKKSVRNHLKSKKE